MVRQALEHGKTIIQGLLRHVMDVPGCTLQAAGAGPMGDAGWCWKLAGGVRASVGMP